MPIGAHVRAGGDLLPALHRGADIGAEVVQVFTQSPRTWKPMQYSDEVLAAYRAAQAHDPKVRATFCHATCHATYLINIAAADPDVLARSRACLGANFTVATAIGARGLVLHVGSHRGKGFDACLPQVVEALRAGPDAAGRLRVCLDTQHLWASGVDYGSVERADAVVARFDAVVGLDRLACLHLNDSKVELGANRDRHENIGEGTIGAAALGDFASHPALVDLPAILEVPGDGHGARATDMAAARAALARGIRRRRRS